MTQQNQKPNQPSNSGFTFEQKIILLTLMLVLASVVAMFITVWQIYEPKAAPQVIVVTATPQLVLPTAEPTKSANYAMPTIPAFGIGGRPIHQETNAVVVTLSVEDQKLADDLMNQMKTDVAK